MVLLLVVGCGGTRYHSTRAAQLIHFTLHDRFVHHDLHELRVVPARHGNWTLILLHGYHAGPSQFLSQPFFDTLRALGARAPVVLLLDGGPDSYWHNRAGGAWGSMVLQEARAQHGPVAIGGISMGGYGALLAAARDRRFCATAVESPALWTSPGATAPGAFDNAQDYERNNVFTLKPPRPLWVAVGSSDPFYAAAVSYAHRAGVHPQLGPGGHDTGFWDAHMPALLRFVTHACD